MVIDLNDDGFPDECRLVDEAIVKSQQVSFGETEIPSGPTGSEGQPQ